MPWPKPSLPATPPISSSSPRRFASGPLLTSDAVQFLWAVQVQVYSRLTHQAGLAVIAQLPLRASCVQLLVQESQRQFQIVVASYLLFKMRLLNITQENVLDALPVSTR